MKIKLYVGAHKTATTHIQQLLHASREVLIENNVKLSIPEDLRESWLPALYEYSDNDVKECKHVIMSERPNSEIWIIAEENISGVSYDLMTNSGIYPDLSKRLSSIKELFNKDTIEIYFSLRSYDTYYRSAYLEVVRNRGYLPFSEFYNANRFQDNNWLNVIDVFSNLFDEENITIWRYEDFEKVMPDLLKDLTGFHQVQNLILRYPIEITRPSISKKTIDVLASLPSDISQKESRQIVERLIDSQSSNDQYIPFTDDEVESFKHKYRSDILKIRKKYPDIRFLDG